MIPKRFHRIWFGARQRPVRYDDYWRMWQNLHPEWEFYTWTEDNLPELFNQEAYDRVPLVAKSCGVPMAFDRALAVQRADVVAYELVNQFGGVYLNCDMAPLRSIDELTQHSAFLGLEDDYHVCNAVMGGEQGHPLFDTTIRRLLPSLIQYGNIGMEVATGPQHLTRVWRSGTWDVEILPREAFYPVHHEDVPYGSEDFGSLMDKGAEKNAYAVHMWGHRHQEGRLNG